MLHTFKVYVHLHGSFNQTLVLGKALQQALKLGQNEGSCPTSQDLEVSSILQVLKRNHLRLMVFDMALEPFLKDGPADVFGVLLHEEESR